MTPLTLDQPIPHVCTLEDVCRILQISEWTYHDQRRRGVFPIPEIEPRIGRRPRFAGKHVREYVEGR